MPTTTCTHCTTAGAPGTPCRCRFGCTATGEGPCGYPPVAVDRARQAVARKTIDRAIKMHSRTRG